MIVDDGFQSGGPAAKEGATRDSRDPVKTVSLTLTTVVRKKVSITLGTYITLTCFCKVGSTRQRVFSLINWGSKGLRLWTECRFAEGFNDYWTVFIVVNRAHIICSFCTGKKLDGISALLVALLWGCKIIQSTELSVINMHPRRV